VLQGVILCKAGHDPTTAKAVSVAGLFGETQYGGIRLVCEGAWTLAGILVPTHYQALNLGPEQPAQCLGRSFCKVLPGTMGFAMLCCPGVSTQAA